MIPPSEQDLDLGRDGADGLADALSGMRLRNEEFAAYLSRMHMRNSELTADVIAGRNALHDM